MIGIIDASVAVKWFAPDGDADDALAEALLRRVAQRPAGYAAPELVYELVSVLCRRLRQATQVSRAIERIGRLGIRRVRLDDQLARRAARLAFERRITGSAACYAALALEPGGKWLTFDRAAAARVEPLGTCELPGKA